MLNAFFQPQTQTHCAQRHVKEMEPSRPASVLVNLVRHFILQPLKKHKAHRGNFYTTI